MGERAGADGRRMRTNGRRVGQRGGCGAVLSAPSKKNKAAVGSLVRYLCLIVYTLSSSVFSGLGDFWGEKSSCGVWGEAPYIMVLGRGMGRSPIYNSRLSCRGAGRPAPLYRIHCGARSPIETAPRDRGIGRSPIYERIYERETYFILKISQSRKKCPRYKSCMTILRLPPRARQ